MKTIFLILVSALILNETLLGQSNPRKAGASREIELLSENDIIFFEDYYYTAGEALSYRRLVNPSSRLQSFFGGKKKDSTKVIVTYQAGMKIFNPYDIYATTPDGMDRPYAGWAYGSLALSYFREPTHGNYFEVESGLIGKSSGMGQFQRWVHHLTTFDPPRGWNTQIRDEVVVNLAYTHFEEWILAEDADLVSKSTINAGTGMNKFSQDLTLRLIHFNPINNSSFTQSRLTWDDASKPGHREIFIFLGYGVDYVMSNIFLEGSVFKDHKSIFTVPALPWIGRGNIGITFSNRKFTWSGVYNRLGREVKGGGPHDYGSLRLGFRL